MKIYMANCTACSDAPSMPFATSAARDAWAWHHNGASGHVVEKAEVVVDTRVTTQLIHDAVREHVFEGAPRKVHPYTDDRWILTDEQALAVTHAIIAEMRK